MKIENIEAVVRLCVADKDDKLLACLPVLLGPLPIVQKLEAFAFGEKCNHLRLTDRLYEENILKYSRLVSAILLVHPKATKYSLRKIRDYTKTTHSYQSNTDQACAWGVLQAITGFF